MCSGVRFRLAVTALGLVALILFASAQSYAASSHGLVNCYDAVRQMITRVRAADCEGRAVTDVEAAQIRDRRREYVRESLETNLTPSVLGKRLASVGAGFVVSRDGTILTNAHVVRDCSTLTLTPPDGGLELAHILATDSRYDLALLKTGYRPKGVARFAPPDSGLPDEVAIVGYPNQGLPPITPILTRGTIIREALERRAPYPVAIRAEIRPGNSGGPILDDSGRVVGIVFAAVDTPAVYERTGRVVRDVGMAVPNSASIGFLARHNVQPDVSQDRPSPADLLEEARAYVLRVDCWK